MKTLQRRPGLFWFLYITIFILSSLVLFFALPLWMSGYHLFWLWVAGGLFVFFYRPKSVPEINHIEKSIPPARWMCRILLLELSLFLLWEGTDYLFLQPVLSFSKPHSTAILISPLPLGLFPWLGIGLFSIGLTYLSQLTNQDTDSATLLMWKDTVNPQAKLVLLINSCARAATSLAFALSLVAAVLLTIKYFFPSLFFAIQGFTVNTSLFYLILFLVAYAGMRFVKKIFVPLARKKTGLYVFFPLLYLALVGLIWCLNFFIVPFNASHTYFPLQHWSETHDLQSYVLLFSVSWQILWVPICGILLSKWSRGYTPREVLGTLLFLAILLHVSFFKLHPFFQSSLGMCWLGSILGWGLLGWLFHDTHNLGWLIHTYLPRVNKHRSLPNFMATLFQNSLFLILLYIYGGLLFLIFLISPIFFSITALCMWLPLILIIKLIRLSHRNQRNSLQKKS